MTETFEGVIEAVSVKTESNTYGLMSNNQWYNGFLPLKAKKGDKVKFEWESSGRWKNIQGSVEVLEEAPEQPTYSKPYVPKYTFEEICGVMDKSMKEANDIVLARLPQATQTDIVNTGLQIFRAAVAPVWNK